MRHHRWHTRILVTVAAVTLAACGGGGGGGGDPAPGGVTFRAATAGDLANRSFAFPPGFFDDQAPQNTHPSTLTIGAFEGETAGFFLRDDTDGSLVGGTLTLGSCTVQVSFLALAGQAPFFPDAGDPDATSVLDPCEIGSDGSLRLTDDVGAVFLSAPGAALSGVLADVTVPLSTAFQVDAPPALYATRIETGTARLTLFDSNILLYTLAVNGLTAGDALTIAHIHGGDVISNGSPVITLAGAPLQPTRPTNPAFAPGATTLAAALLLTPEEVASLLAPGNAFYVNIHSQDFGSGLVRGQIGETIDLAFNVPLTVAAEAAAPVDATHAAQLVGRTESGFAQLRLLADDSLAFKLRVDGLAATDALTASHIHAGGSTVAGGVVVPLVANFAGAVVAVDTLSLLAADADRLRDPAEPFYVNVHSTQVPAGLVRGQLRDLVSFANRIQPILTASCATPSCHGSPLVAPMSLAAGSAYANLVPGRVQAGNPAGSLLYQRIIASGAARMPPDAPLPADQQELIRIWIAQGAPNN